MVMRYIRKPRVSRWQKSLAEGCASTKKTVSARVLLVLDASTEFVARPRFSNYGPISRRHLYCLIKARRFDLQGHEQFKKSARTG